MVNAVVKAIDSAGHCNVLAMCIDTTCCTVVALDSKGKTRHSRRLIHELRMNIWFHFIVE